MTAEELLLRQLRMSAMHAAISLYCCYAGNGHGGDSGTQPSVQEVWEQFGGTETLQSLIMIRDELLQTTSIPENPPLS